MDNKGVICSFIDWQGWNVPQIHILATVDGVEVKKGMQVTL
jgi:hypothetical protein